MIAALLVALPALAFADQASRLADTYVDAVEKVNRDHARKPKEMTEEELAEELPKKAVQALNKLVGARDSDEVFDALARCGEAALDLDRFDDFERVRERLMDAPKQSAALGMALSRPRYVLRGIGELEPGYLERFAEVMDAVLAGYDEVFGFRELSKVPGKKLRVRIHLEERVNRPPHFAPQFPYHSEIDFPVADPEVFRSPTSDGKFLFYGLCHELGHVVAMWGDRSNQEDHHAWAHYTGIVICQHVSERFAGEGFMKEIRDARWRTIDKAAEGYGATEPGPDSYESVLALFVKLHEEVGPKAIGDAINFLDEEDRRLRINRVRYYAFDDLARGFEKTLQDKKEKKLVEELIP